MNKTPTIQTPTSFTVYNGDPTRFNHPLWIDSLSTWIAAGWKPSIPVVASEPLDSSVVHTIPILAPPYTRWIAIGLFLGGAGDVSMSFADDTYTSELADIEYGDGSAPAIADAEWVWFTEEQTGVSADGGFRALDVTHQSSPHLGDLEITITDAGGGDVLKIFGVAVLCRAAYSDTALPA